MEFRKSDYSYSWAKANYFNFRALNMARNIRNQLNDLFKRLDLPLISIADELSTGKDSSHLSQEMINVILRTFCSAYYVHSAKRHPNRPLFYHYISSTHPDSFLASGASSANSARSLLALHINPSSALLSSITMSQNISQSLNHLDWVIYHDVIYSTRATIRHVSIVDPLWVQPHFDKFLQDVDHLTLSGLSDASLKLKEEKEKQRQLVIEKKQQERNRRIDEARQRYLKRNRTSKETT